MNEWINEWMHVNVSMTLHLFKWSILNEWILLEMCGEWIWWKTVIKQLLRWLGKALRLLSTTRDCHVLARHLVVLDKTESRKHENEILQDQWERHREIWWQFPVTFHYDANYEWLHFLNVVNLFTKNLSKKNMENAYFLYLHKLIISRCEVIPKWILNIWTNTTHLHHDELWKILFVSFRGPFCFF